MLVCIQAYIKRNSKSEELCSVFLTLRIQRVKLSIGTFWVFVYFYFCMERIVLFIIIFIYMFMCMFCNVRNINYFLSNTFINLYESAHSQLKNHFMITNLIFIEKKKLFKKDLLLLITHKNCCFLCVDINYFFCAAVRHTAIFYGLFYL